MQVTFTNTTGSPIYLSAIYMVLPALGSITTRRTRAQLDAEQQLKAYVQAGTITLSFTEETGDDAGIGSAGSLVSYSNTTRPAASTVPAFSAIWNTSDNAVNWSDGTNWRSSDGVIT